MSHEQQDDALIEAYRRASASDADRPGAATRAAILAEAAASARKNAPAANDSRYWLRAVAGIGVLGIGVLLWRQTDDQLPGDVPVVASAPVTQGPESVARSERVPVQENGAEPMRADRANDLPRPQAFPASPPALTESNPPQPARPTADEDQDASEVTVTGTRIQRPNSDSAVAAAAAAPRTLDSAALLRQYFPTQYESGASHSVWLVLDAAGNVVQSGELVAGQRLEDLAPQVARALGARVAGNWQVQTLRNARDQPIELAIARLP